MGGKAKGFFTKINKKKVFHLSDEIEDDEHAEEEENEISEKIETLLGIKMIENSNNEAKFIFISYRRLSN